MYINDCYDYTFLVCFQTVCYFFGELYKNSRRGTVHLYIDKVYSNTCKAHTKLHLRPRVFSILSTILDKNSGKNRFVTQNNTFVYFLRNFGPHLLVSKLFLVMELEIDIPTLIMGHAGANYIYLFDRLLRNITSFYSNY